MISVSLTPGTTPAGVAAVDVVVVSQWL